MKATVSDTSGKLARSKILSMQTKIAVVSNFGLRINPARVVGTGRYAVLAADATIRIHRDNIGFGIVVASPRRADFHAGRILALLAGNSNVVPIRARHALQKYARTPWR